MSFTIHDDRGRIVAQITQSQASRLTREANGYFDDGVGHNRRFVFMSDCMWGAEQGTRLYIYHSYYLKF